jgi:hypothetical protein
VHIATGIVTSRCGTRIRMYRMRTMRIATETQSRMILLNLQARAVPSFAIDVCDSAAADYRNPAVPNLLYKPFNTAIMWSKAVQEHGAPIRSED